MPSKSPTPLPLSSSSSSDERTPLLTNHPPNTSPSELPPSPTITSTTDPENPSPRDLTPSPTTESSSSTSSIDSTWSSAWHSCATHAQSSKDVTISAHTLPSQPTWSRALRQSMRYVRGKVGDWVVGRFTRIWGNGRPVDRERHVVWLFDNVAWRVRDGEDAGGGGKSRGNGDSAAGGTDGYLAGMSYWRTEAVAAYFRKDSGRPEGLVARSIAFLFRLVPKRLPKRMRRRRERTGKKSIKATTAEPESTDQGNAGGGGIIEWAKRFFNGGGGRLVGRGANTIVVNADINAYDANGSNGRGARGGHTEDDACDPPSQYIDGTDSAELRMRVFPMFDTVVSNRHVDIRFAGSVRRLGPSTADGLSTSTLDFTASGSSYSDGAILRSQTTRPGMPEALTPMITTVVHPTGWGVISDIDDTIKRTNTPSVRATISNTFFAEPQAVPGMSKLYRHLREKLDRPPFFYVSASPYNLYPWLRWFLHEEHFPRGMLVLRNMAWRSVEGFAALLSSDIAPYKRDRLSWIWERFPEREFVCLGDSTQDDAEVYADMWRFTAGKDAHGATGGSASGRGRRGGEGASRRNPNWIRRVWIRLAPEVDGTWRNSAERFERVFEGVPREIWETFRDPGELVGRVEGLVGDGLKVGRREE